MNQTVISAPGTAFRVALTDCDSNEGLIAAGIIPGTAKWRLSDPNRGTLEPNPFNATFVDVQLTDDDKPVAMLFFAETTDGKAVSGCIPILFATDSVEPVGLRVVPITENVETTELAADPIEVNPVPPVQTEPTEPQVSSGTIDINPPPPVQTEPEPGEGEEEPTPAGDDKEEGPESGGAFEN